jgi:hydroxypyruvate isomerase
MFDLAVCAEMVFLRLPFTERVRRISDLGFAVEIWDWTAHDVQALVRTGATFSSMNGYVHGGLADDPESLVAGAAESVAVAARLGCPRLVLHGTELKGGLAVRPVDQVTGSMWLTAYRTLRRLAALGERARVTFCLENLNTEFDHPGVPFARAEDTLALVDAVGSPAMRMMLDLYHAQIGEGNLTSLLRRAGPLIGEVQVAEVPGRCEPGTGEIDYTVIAGVLAEMGYRGTVGLEAYASEDDELALDRFRAAFTVPAVHRFRREPTADPWQP